MKTAVLFAISLFILFSCNSNQKNVKWEIEVSNEKEFNLTLNDFLEKTIVKDSVNSILVQFYSDNQNDTILKILNSPVLNCENYSGYSTFNDRTILVFCPESLVGRLNDFIKFEREDNIRCLKKIDTSGLYVSDEISFKLRSGKLVW